MGKFCDILEELVAEIMSRLPPETLIELKCVCKSWHVLINTLMDDPTFVAKHLYNAKLRKLPETCLFLKCAHYPDGPRRKFESEKIFFTVYDEQHDCLGGFQRDLMSPLRERYEEFWTSLGMLNVGSHCDGIICLHNSFNLNVLLCNPATRKYKILSTSCLDPGKLSVTKGVGLVSTSWLDQDKLSVTKGVGFGYDWILDDYKVVRIVSSKCVLRAELYTMGLDSWKEIKHMEFPSKTFSTRDDLYCNGIYYWFVTLDSGSNMILSFDMCNEEFHWISLPDNPKNEGFETVKNLELWNDSVALFYFPSDGYTKSYEMWVLHHSSGAHKGSYSWSHHLTTGPLESIALGGFWKSDEFLLINKDDTLVSYNLHTQKLRSFPYRGLIASPIIYVPSLVSVDGRKKLVNPS